MNYLIYGTEQYLINKNIEKIIDDNKDSLVLRFDGSFKEDPTEEVLSNCLTDSLFGDKTIILFKNPIFLTGKTDNDSVEKLIEYLKKPSENCILVLYSSYSSFKSNLKLFKIISSECETHCYIKLDNDRFHSECDKAISSSKIPFDYDAKEAFISNCGNDLEIFYNCLNILKQYGGNVNFDVLEQLTYSSDDFDIFSLINAIISKDTSKSMKYVNKLRKDEGNIFGLISLLSSQLMYLYSVSYYSNIYNDEKEIMAATNTSNPYRLKMAYKTLKNIGRQEILNLVNKLSILDYEFKTDSSLDHKLLFDLFITSLNS